MQYMAYSCKRNKNGANKKKNKTKQKLFKMLSKKKIFGIYFFGMFIV